MTRTLKKLHTSLTLFVCLVGFFVGITFAEAATMGLSPSTGVHTSGSTFTARVFVNTQGSSINAAEATLSFNPAQLSVVGISRGSVFNLWTVEPTYSNSAGTISFSGGTTSGYTGSGGTILNITFRANGGGTGKVNFSNGSVLAADGRGTNVLTSMGGGTYTIATASEAPEPEVIEYVAPANTPSAPVVTSDTHAADGWSQSTAAKLAWSLPSGVTAVRTLLDGNPSSIPTKVYDTPINSITLEVLEEGVQYFHIQFQNADGWGRVTHYRLAVDTKDPNAIDITLATGTDPFSPNQQLKVVAEDDTSAVNRYLVQLNGATPFEYLDETGSSTIPLTDLEPGYYTVQVEAFDEAGNSIIKTFAFTITAFDKPIFTEYPSRVGTDVIPVLKGLTRPNASVEVAFRRASESLEEARVYTVASDDDGVFTVIPDDTLTLGVYELTAVAVDTFGATSERSDPVRIVVEQPGYMAIGGWLVSFLSVLIPLIALAALLILVVAYFFTRLRRVRTFVMRETDEALEVLEREFQSLQSLLTTEKKALAKSRKTNKLTKAESALVDTTSSAIAEAHERIKKEIADVDDIVT